MVAELKDKGHDQEGIYTWQGGVLRRKGKMVVGNNSDLKNKIMQLMHDSSQGGHSGVLATTKRISLFFYWKGLEKDVRNYIRSCAICQT